MSTGQGSDGEPGAGSRGQRTGGPTVYDVARVAGVAPSTVSRTFARPGRVSYETAERVRAVAEELGYRARSVSRSGSERDRRTNMIALVVSDISNPAYFDLIRGAEEAAAEAGYIILLAHTHESDRKEREALERTLPMVDGILLTSSRMSDSSIRMMAKQKPTIIVNRAVKGVASVVPDNPRGMRRAAEHLAGAGRRSILYVAGPEASWADGMRWRALRESAMELELKVQRTGPFEPTSDGGAQAALRWLEHRCPAVILYNDLMALGFLREMRRHGVRVPEDVAVVGFDNIQGLDLVSPSLTSVAAPMQALGATAVTNLLAMTRGASPTASRPMVLPTRLVVRESSALPPATTGNSLS
ncbi:LacI family transcriptional regulator [Kocuria dechangensis]|uniref:LacI family transcriptional regulator n=1 Tax=Kocuria dechangensis TaxID=1176249 RepID=A0A917H8X3_9MICC|nr:LacI family DNA-binding transcriptional regulator [Kocuria dechangensis]GGG70992.1 LacI family transcriptional regulator [Kocuria dechangensis]